MLAGKCTVWCVSSSLSASYSSAHARTTANPLTVACQDGIGIRGQAQNWGCEDGAVQTCGPQHLLAKIMFQNLAERISFAFHALNKETYFGTTAQKTVSRSLLTHGSHHRRLGLELKQLSEP